MGLRAAARALSPRRGRAKVSPQGGAGYDNARENIDPHVKTKVLSTQEVIGNNISGANFFKNGTEIGDLYVNTAGDTMTGDLVVPNMYVEGDIIHQGDLDTYMLFGTNEIAFIVGGLFALDMTSTSLLWNATRSDIDVRISGDTQFNLFYTNAGTDRVGILTNNPSTELEVVGTILGTNLTATEHISGATLNVSEALYVGADEKVGIGTTTPAKKLTVFVGGTEDHVQLRLGTLGFGYDIGRNYTDGFLKFKGSQAGFTGYDFLSDDDSSLVTIIDNGNVGIGTTNPDAKLHVSGALLFNGDASGLPYGEVEGEYIGLQIASAAQNTWYPIASGAIVAGELHLMTDNGTGMLTATKGGRYLCNYSVALESSAANDHLETAVSGAGLLKGHGHVESKFANEEEALGGTCIINLPASTPVELVVRTTDAGTPNITIDDSDLTMVYIGGR